MAVAATAAFGMQIAGTPHDLSGGYGTTNLGSGEICIYCHTPHNPVQAIPLWNRNNPCGAGFTLYKTSPTLTAATKASTFADTSVSLFCMSCHDGATGLGNIARPATYTMDTTTVIPVGDSGNLGTNLTNDHPVGFNYNTAQTQDPTLVAIGTAAASLGTVGGGSYPFFDNGLGQGQMMECASCHKVHDNEFGKFLRANNAGSNLCLACHIK